MNRGNLPGSGTRLFQIAAVVGAPVGLLLIVYAIAAKLVFWPDKPVMWLVLAGIVLIIIGAIVARLNPARWRDGGWGPG